jgi:hypothetical protein
LVKKQKEDVGVTKDYDLPTISKKKKKKNNTAPKQSTKGKADANTTKTSKRNKRKKRN